jgi:ABC-type amino acid transport substrate-binding protein
LAHSDTKTGEVSGVSVDLAHLLAQRLGLPLELIVLDAAGKAVQAVVQVSLLLTRCEVRKSPSPPHTC